MVQLQNFFFFITSMVVPRGTAAPVLLKWFVSRDVPTGASSYNGTIIPIPIPLFPLPRDRSAKRERALRSKGQTLRPKGNEQQNDKMRCPGHPHIERRVEGFGPVAFPAPPSSSGACLGGVPPEIGLEALALPTS